MLQIVLKTRVVSLFEISSGLDGSRATSKSVLRLTDKHGRKRVESMDLLAETRRSLADAIRQLKAINAGVPIAKPLTRDQAINIVTEQIGLFESVLRRYGDRGNTNRS